MKIAIVLTFDNNFNIKIKKIKKNFKKKFNNFLFINDFPHLTLLTIETYTSIKKIEKILKFKKKIPNKIILGKGNIFENDILTNGDTFYFNVRKETNLVNIQINIAKKLKKLSIKKKKFKKTFKEKSLERKNYFEFGFPFIGKNWKPHVSICSVIENDISTNFKKKFKKINFFKKILIKDILLCEVRNKQLTKLKSINVL